MAEFSGQAINPKIARITGKYVSQTTGNIPYRAFIPNFLPPEPPLGLGAVDELRTKATLALGSLNAVSRFLPDKNLFLYSYVRKEAVLSSQIEGTQSTLEDLLLFENDAVPGVPIDDVAEVSSYVAALEYGLEELRKGLPISNRLIRGMHRVLLSSGRGSNKSPGEFREGPVWLGGSRPNNALFVPPPHTEIPRLIADLERFLNDVPAKTPTLIKAALSHVQFETVHPFSDGNGRIGRLLISLLLAAEKMLDEPLLYLSLYFKTHRQTYYDLLQRVRTDGDWESWTLFFLNGVAEVADGAARTAHRLLTLFDSDRIVLEKEGRHAGTLVRVHDLLKHEVVVTSTKVSQRLNVSLPTAIAALGRLWEMGIVRETTGKQRNRNYVYSQYLDILNE
ncbi:MAG TPA: Fic family protein [Candidatus Kapabacteria bacterium]|nr:Fic family protein [Candidatus Kapabacteria bacterium]